MTETAKDIFTSLVTGKSYFTCEVCGNEYDKAFEVHMDGKTHVFDLICLPSTQEAGHFDGRPLLLSQLTAPWGHLDRTALMKSASNP